MKEVSHGNEVFEKIDFSDAGLPGEEFEACTFNSCNFSHVDLSDRLFTDCQFTDCNLSMAKVSGTGLRNVDFLSCKVIGIDFSDCLPFLFAVSFERCSLDYSHFIKNRLKNTKFKECIIREANFTEADLTGASFDNCDLLNTAFVQSDLSRADFRTSRNYTINLETNTARKAKFSLSGVTGLLRQYDIIVVE
jgi:fluoroquinolone resistance protein